ncbi:glycine cleavage system protein GcvH [Glaciimonas immobilis]|uniref:Glycine cleavage system H protein n=1 Tax=Glaciimonas immobilis TaxID=728004 RepID=A0A840S032_9BURK|nr:glycine cleavage system protein GcvH [Glaciimonas immobilis]KAF3998336.1 glycine cleavage system protein GcvH [Glaciimonas immobilis]MBB5201959.1 glycine cleavage system H protein [Glaciimonas immobilis]
MSATQYTKQHEWLKVEDGGLVTVGITEFAQDHLGDLVYVQLPDVGRELKKGEEVVVIESVKTASEILMPAAGIVTEVNESLIEEPGRVNEDPLGDGWFFRFQLRDPLELADLMDGDAYKAFVAGLG